MYIYNLPRLICTFVIKFAFPLHFSCICKLNPGKDCSIGEYVLADDAQVTLILWTS